MIVPKVIAFLCCGLQMGGLRLVVELPPPLTRADTSSYQTRCCLLTAHFLTACHELHWCLNTCRGRWLQSQKICITWLYTSLPIQAQMKNANVSKVYQMCVSRKSNSLVLVSRSCYTWLENRKFYRNLKKKRDYLCIFFYRFFVQDPQSNIASSSLLLLCHPLSLHPCSPQRVRLHLLTCHLIC